MQLDANSRRTNLLIYLGFAIGGALLFLPFLGNAHLFDWDEINFAECAREMLVTKKYFLVTIDYKPFWEKPPLFIWMQVLSMKMFGVSDYAARLPNALCGIATLLLLFRIGSVWKDARFGLLWVLAYVGSLLPHLYFKSGIIDPWFNFFIFTGIYFFARYQMNKKAILSANPILQIILSALFIGLAILTKGPVALLVVGLCVMVYMLGSRTISVISFGHAVLYLLIVAIVGGSWFGVEILTGHLDTVKEFIQYQIKLFTTEDATQGGPFYYHFLVLLIGCFPASIFAIRGMVLLKGEEPKFFEAKRWMKILFWVVLILFSIVKTKVVHYSSLCYYPLTFYAARSMYELSINTVAWRRWMTRLFMFIGVPLAIVLLLLPVIGKNIDWIKDSVRDPFALANLQAQVNWSYIDCIVGLLMLASIVLLFFYLQRNNVTRGLQVLFLGTMVAVNLAVALLAPKIGEYTQQAVVEFCQGLKGKDVYIFTFGHKSYAHYFYAEIQPWSNEESTKDYWLGEGKIDKPAYFISKITKVDYYEKKYPRVKELYRKNGFVFLERQPPAP